MTIQHLKLSPATIAILVASSAFAAIVIAGYFRAAQAIDPSVTMEVGHQATANQAPTRRNGIPTTIDGEVARTAERIGEATALALSASLYAASEQIRGHALRGEKDLISGLAARNFLPPGLAPTRVGGSLVSTYGSVSVRYRSEPLGVEVISLGNKPSDGPALIVRIPDELLEKGEAKLYIAGSLGSVRVPAPFSPAAEVIALGWSPEPLRSLK